MLLTAKEAAEKLGISLRQMQTLLKNNRLPARKFGNNWMIDEADLEFVRERPITGRPKKKADVK
jgi:excisionase family DNA binding protein